MQTVAVMTPPNEVNATGPMALPDAKHVWLADADDAIERLAHTGRAFTSDDVRRLIGPPEHPNWWGIAFAKAKKQGLIRAVGDGVSTVKSRNGGHRRVWRSTHDHRH